MADEINVGEGHIAEAYDVDGTRTWWVAHHGDEFVGIRERDNPNHRVLLPAQCFWTLVAKFEKAGMRP